MIKLENYEVVGWEHAIRGMRNPKNSWARSDSADCLQQHDCDNCPAAIDGECASHSPYHYVIGPNDHELTMKLAKGGPVHAKYRRMIAVYVDITAPLYWWKEFKTYRAGRKFGDDEPDVIPDLIPDDYLEQDIEMNSCSTMHKIHSKEFVRDDFSCEHLDQGDTYSTVTWGLEVFNDSMVLDLIIAMLNHKRQKFLETNDKQYWYDMIQLLPTSYNQRRTVMLNYEVLYNMYHSRKNHKLDEWREMCAWIEKLPYSEIITGGTKDDY